MGSLLIRPDVSGVHMCSVAPGLHACQHPAYAAQPDHHRREDAEDRGRDALCRHDPRLGELQRAVPVAPDHNAVTFPLRARFRNPRPSNLRKCSAAWWFSKLATITDACAVGSG